MFFIFEVGSSDPHLLVLLLILPLHYFFLLLVLYVLDLISQDLHFLQSEVYLFAEFVAEIFVDGCFLVVEDRFEWFVQIQLRMLRNLFLLLFGQHVLHVHPLLRLVLLEDIRDCDPAKRRFLFEDTFANILIKLWLLLYCTLVILCNFIGGV